MKMSKSTYTALLIAAVMTASSFGHAENRRNELAPNPSQAGQGQQGQQGQTQPGQKPVQPSQPAQVNKPGATAPQQVQAPQQTQTLQQVNKPGPTAPATTQQPVQPSAQDLQKAREQVAREQAEREAEARRQQQQAQQEREEMARKIESARRQGQSAGDCVSNQVINVYGSAENFRYNAIVGIREGAQMSAVFSSNQLQNYTQYQQGLSYGRDVGTKQGEKDGLDAGRGQGQDDGARLAARSFESSVDDSQPPLTTVAPHVNAPGFRTPTDWQPASLNDVIGKKTDEFFTMLDSMPYTDGDLVLRASTLRNLDTWTLQSSLFNNAYDPYSVASKYSFDWAFDQWDRQAFGARCMAGYKLVNKGSATREELNAFQNAFQNTYRGRIENGALGNKIGAINPSARMMGNQLGQSAFLEYVNGVGMYDGQTETYSPAAQRKFVSSYKPSFESSYNAKALELAGAIVIQDLSAQLVAVETGSPNAVRVGQTINVQVTKLKNIGGQAGAVPVTVTGSALSSATGQTLDVEAHRTMKTPKLVSGIAVVSDRVGPNEDTDVTIQVGGASVTTQVHIDWSQELRYFAKLNKTSAEYVKHASYIKNAVQTEHQKVLDKRGVFTAENPYASDSTATLLGQMLSAKNETKSSNFADLKAGLIAVLGEPPGFFSRGSTKDIYNSAKSIIDRL